MNLPVLDSSFAPNMLWEAASLINMDHFREACQLQICVSLIETVRRVRRELGFDLRKQADMLLQRFKDTMMILFFKVIQYLM